jgi:hypothetical protein
MTENEFMWPKLEPEKGTWFGSEKLKARTVAQMVRHREDDEIIQGIYQESSEGRSGYQGCLIGCTLPRRIVGRDRRGYEIPGLGFVPDGNSAEHDVETLYGIPEPVASLMEAAFENTDNFEAAANFALLSIIAIPVGVRYPEPEGDEDNEGAYPPYGGLYESLPAGLAFLRTAGVSA